MMAGCCRPPEVSTVQKVKGIGFIPLGDTLTVMLDGKPVQIVNLGGDKAEVIHTPEKKRGGLINVYKDKSTNTTVAGNDNQVGDKNKDKSEDKEVSGDGNVVADKVKSPAVTGDGNELKESKGLNPLWLLALLVVGFGVYIWRKTR